MSRTNLAVAASLPLAALFVALGDSLSAANADNLIPALMSIQHWTPFFWGNADRVGSLVPALALPIHGPIANWVAQCFLTATAGLACFALIPRYVLPGGAWKSTAPLAALLWLCLVSTHVLAGWLIPGQPYGVGLALGLLALLLLDRSWRPAQAAGIVLLDIAFWVHSGLGLLLLPLWAARRFLLWFHDGPGSAATDAPWYETPLVVGLCQGLWLVHYAATDTEPRYLGHVPFWEVFRAIGAAASNSTTEVGIAFPIMLGVTVYVFAHLPRERQNGPLGPLALAFASLLSVVPVILNAWVDANGHSARYYMPSMVIMTCAVAAWVPVHRRRYEVGLAVLVPLAALLRFGAPSMAGVRTQLATMAPFAVQADDIRCTALSGDYWAIWPEVLGVLELRHQHGDPLPVYGLVSRGEATIEMARAVPAAQRKVCHLTATVKP